MLYCSESGDERWLFTPTDVTLMQSLRKYVNYARTQYFGRWKWKFVWVVRPDRHHDACPACMFASGLEWCWGSERLSTKNLSVVTGEDLASLVGVTDRLDQINVRTCLTASAFFLYIVALQLDP